MLEINQMRKSIRRKLPEWLVTTLSVLVIALVVLGFFLLSGVTSPKKATPPMTVTSSDIQVPLPAVPLYIHPLEIGGRKISVAYAVTPAEQAQGLSGTTSLADGRGMLFIFPTDTSMPFWMKDMNYALDIIWISEDKTVADITPNLDPASYPDSFGPSVPVRYVLEVPAGFVIENGINIGDRVSF